MLRNRAYTGDFCWNRMTYAKFFRVRHGEADFSASLTAAYTAGAAVQLAYQPELVPGLIGPHELVHLAVVVGIAFHWQFIFGFLVVWIVCFDAQCIVRQD